MAADRDSCHRARTAQRWNGDGLTRSAFANGCLDSSVSSSPIPFPRPPRSVSSGCH